MIVCLEGVDACGKGTQAALLVERLNARLWKFPDRRTLTGEIIYEHLEGKWSVTPSNSSRNEALLEPLAFQALQLANRMEVATEIFQAAAKGNVVFDRYWPSGYAYGKTDGLDGEYLVNLHRWLPQPDLFLLLDIDLEHSVGRRPERRDRYEKRGDAMRQVIDNYRELWRKQRAEAPLKWVTIDARGAKEETARQINEAVASLRARFADS